MEASAMKRTGSSVLLLMSGVLLVCGLPDLVVRREFHYVGLRRTWAEAQRYCREKFSDLATIQSSGNITEAKTAAGNTFIWIGLFNGTWKWSQAEEQDDSPSTWFTNWNIFEPTSETCVTLGRDGKWSSKDCEGLYYSVCYNAANNSHILVQEPKSWFEAQAHCRLVYTDLSSIRNQSDNDKITALLTGITMSPFSFPSTSSQFAWTGLHRSTWVWSDGSDSSFRQWNLIQTSGREDCAIMSLFTLTWYWKSCDATYTFLCQKDIIPVKMQSIKVRVRAGSADLNDPVVQDSILQQLKERMDAQDVTDVKLRWRTQSDGKVFRREEETAPPAVCQEDYNCVMA